MSGRRRPRICSFAIVIVLGVAMVGCGTSSGAKAAPSNGTTFDLAVPKAVQHLAFVDQDGKTRTLASYAGKTLVLSPFLTLCQEICPLTSVNIRAADQAVKAAGLGGQVEFIELTIDPGRDNRAHLKAFQHQYGAESNWEFLGGTASQVSEFWKAFHLSYGNVPESAGETPRDWVTGAKLTYDVDHQDVLYVLRPNGRLAWLVDGTPWVNNAAVPATLKAFLDQDGIKNYTKRQSVSWDVNDLLQAVTYVTGMSITVSGSGHQ